MKKGKKKKETKEPKEPNSSKPNVVTYKKHYKS